MLCWGEVVVDVEEGAELMEKPEFPDEVVALVVLVELVAEEEPVFLVVLEVEVLPVGLDAAVVPAFPDEGEVLTARPTVLATPITLPTAPAVLSTLPTVPEAPAMLPMVLPTPVTAPTVLPTL